jgi:hypothetical protein
VDRTCDYKVANLTTFANYSLKSRDKPVHPKADHLGIERRHRH